MGVSVPGEVDEKLGDARRGLCLAGPGAVAPLALVFRVHPAFPKSFVAFKELYVRGGGPVSRKFSVSELFPRISSASSADILCFVPI